MNLDYSKQWEKYMKRFPYFLDKSDDSNFVKIQKPIFNQLMAYRNACFICNLSGSLERPIQIYKEQEEAYKYRYHYIIHLPYIKEVEVVYYDENGEVKDTVNWEFDVPDETSYLEATYPEEGYLTSKNIVPSDKILINISTFGEYYLSKGFPENDEITIDDDGYMVPDFFNHEKALDELGALFNVPRLKFKDYNTEKTKNGFNELDYLSKTYPKFNKARTEDDYHYQLRIREYMENYNVKSPVLLELLKEYRVNGELYNRKHDLLHMVCNGSNGGSFSFFRILPSTVVNNGDTVTVDGYYTSDNGKGLENKDINVYLNNSVNKTVKTDNKGYFNTEVTVDNISKDNVIYASTDNNRTSDISIIRDYDLLNLSFDESKLSSNGAVVIKLGNEVNLEYFKPFDYFEINLKVGDNINNSIRYYPYEKGKEFNYTFEIKENVNYSLELIFNGNNWFYPYYNLIAEG